MTIGPSSSILALDMGQARVGVAQASAQSRLATPLTTINNDANFKTTIAKLIDQHQVIALVVGLPRGLNGQLTEQTKLVRAAVADLKTTLTVPIYEQDESLTSVQAEIELTNRGKAYNKGDIDALAATYILEDFLSGRGKELFK